MAHPKFSYGPENIPLSKVPDSCQAWQSSRSSGYDPLLVARTEDLKKIQDLSGEALFEALGKLDWIPSSRVKGKIGESTIVNNKLVLGKP